MNTRYLDVNGGRIAYDETGPEDGQLVLCLHGLGETRRSYRLLTPLLTAAGYRVVTTDIRGCGESSAEFTDYSPEAVGADALALLRHLGRPAVVLGHSYAGASAVWLATEAPERVRGVVLLGAFVRDAKMNPVMGLLAKMVARSAVLWGAYYKTLYPTRKPADFDAYVASLKASLRQPGHLAALAAMMGGSRADTAARVPRVTCPALVVMGTKDSDFPDPAAEARWIADTLGGPATVEMVDGSGHYAMTDTPDTTAAAITAFLKEV
ncbi:alpha/beta fold hydrolase [Kutzneria sp. 744]|uniref:alpha/beta fold hydrolase n=1 Tax=Kutzneria sp. (strain 744) TaxID=345341 RepID=UPI0003EED8BE|nr:alpha/beta hydrolase [Kutzneria sp. 744]EWM16328.1 hydrolase [Kutzneria sp. 744]